MKSVEFIVPGKPQGKGRPRVVNRGGFSRAYTPSQTVLYENWIRTCYQSSTDYRFPDDTPLEMRIVARFAVPKSYSAKKRRACLSGDILAHRTGSAQKLKGRVIRPFYVGQRLQHAQRRLRLDPQLPRPIQTEDTVRPLHPCRSAQTGDGVYNQSYFFHTCILG